MGYCRGLCRSFSVRSLGLRSRCVLRYDAGYVKCNYCDVYLPKNKCIIINRLSCPCCKRPVKTKPKKKDEYRRKLEKQRMEAVALA